MAPRNLENTIEKAWIELAKENIFYSNARMRFTHVESETVRTIKLIISADGNFKLVFNPRRIYNKGVNFTKALIKHELFHIIFGHIFIKVKNKREKGIWDLAMDAAVNQYIKELDAIAEPLDTMLSEGHSPDNEYMFVTAPPEMLNKTAEEYYKYALKFFEDNKIADLEEIEEKRNETDSHEFESEITQEMAFDIVSEFVEKSYDKSSGDSLEPVEIAHKVIKGKSKLDWKTILRRFFGSSVVTDEYRTIMRPNRRYDSQPGWRKIRGPEVAVIVDTSGSIIDEEYDRFFSEIEEITRTLGGTLHLIQADSKVQSTQKYIKGKWKNLTLKGKGSTDLQPAVDYVEESLRPEGIIIFTDGFVEMPNIRRRSLFVLSKNYNPDFFNQSLQYYGVKSALIMD